ncbi:hypothetical protein [Luteimonas abyssi]|uniref:hypothetical protein n=1 Tax=Luteimonas abyssi TaxID=1247514 RepID=UPI000B153B1B|nr:hypothetical protein [Luteimonas abyssi]
MTTNTMWICTMVAAIGLAGCSAERWSERDAQTRCERMVGEVLDEAGGGDLSLPEPVVAAAPGGDGYLVTWHQVRIAETGAHGPPRDATTVQCQFSLEGDVAWIEFDGERVFDPATRTDAVRAQRDAAASGADDDTQR